MSTMELLQMGFGVVFEPSMFIMVCIAIILGTVFGALPGVSATMAVALGLTFTCVSDGKSACRGYPA